MAIFPGAPSPNAGGMLTLHSDGAGGTFVAYFDDAFSGDVWMAHVSQPSTAGVEPRPRRGSRLALSAPRPNPARASVALHITLPDESAARVDLLDVTGRVLRSQGLQDAGVHRLELAGLEGLAPGSTSCAPSRARERPAPGSCWALAAFSGGRSLLKKNLNPFSRFFIVIRR